MPTDYDNGSGYGQRAPAPAVFANPSRAQPSASGYSPQPLETPEQKAAREARAALIATPIGGGNGYQAPAVENDPDNPYANWSQAQINQIGITHNGTMLPGRVDAGIKTGNLLPGDYAYGQEVGKQDNIHKNLSVGEANAQRVRDFGLGSNNNAQTAAMLGQAQATGDKYSAAFGNSAGFAGQNASAALGRGLGMYDGNTSQYAQGLANAQQSRGLQTGSYDALMRFANQGQGPSAAQAQLLQATDANTQNTLALARSGRGLGGGQAALRQAASQNAVTQQGANQQLANLRANEYTAYQQQKLAALGGAGSLAGQIVGGDQAYGQLGLAGAQYQTNTALQGTQLNDSAAQGWADRQTNAYQQGLGAEMGAQTQGLNINATALAGRENEYASANQTKPDPISEQAYGRFSRGDHPILSEGDALLADSARSAPVSSYEYKNPNDPGAKPGVQVGQMAQDLASHPVTRGMVDQDPRTGKLFIDGGRAAMTGLAQNHGQQNQLDALTTKIAELEGLLRRKPRDAKATSFKPDQSAGGL